MTSDLFEVKIVKKGQELFTLSEVEEIIQEKEEQLAYADRQLDDMAEIISNKDDLIHKLGLLLIDSTNKVDD